MGLFKSDLREQLSPATRQVRKGILELQRPVSFPMKGVVYQAMLAAFINPPSSLE